MIKLTKLNGKEFYINAELVQLIEETPDTVITFTNRERVMVKESADEVVKRVMEYARSVRSFSSLGG